MFIRRKLVKSDKIAKNYRKCRFVKVRMLITLWKTKAKNLSTIKRNIFYLLKNKRYGNQNGFIWTVKGFLLIWFSFLLAGISSLGCIFIAVCLPETKGKLPFEIASFYEKKHKVTSWIARHKPNNITNKKSQDWRRNQKSIVF